MAHDHSHHHGPTTYGRIFALGVALNLGFVAIEFAVGSWAHSLALMADAAHNLSDVAGLLLAWVATILAQRPPSPRRTYGMRRATILAALGNALLLLVAVGGIVWEAVQRFQTPAPVAGLTVMAVAAVGIVINTATALLFVRGQHDLNIRGAFLHMATDAAVSAGVVVAGGLIWFSGWLWLDPVISLVIAGVIVLGTWGVFRDALNLALDAVPRGIDAAAVQRFLHTLPGVTASHDLHIWALSTTEPALTVHLVTSEPARADALRTSAVAALHDRYGIEHATIQVEAQPCAHDCGGGEHG